MGGIDHIRLQCSGGELRPGGWGGRDRFRRHRRSGAGGAPNRAARKGPPALLDGR